jgi:hypothetical protein
LGVQGHHGLHSETLLQKTEEGILADLRSLAGKLANAPLLCLPLTWPHLLNCKYTRVLGQFCLVKGILFGMGLCPWLGSCVSLGLAGKPWLPLESKQFTEMTSQGRKMEKVSAEMQMTAPPEDLEFSL